MNLRESQPLYRNSDDFLGNPWESVGNGIFVQRKGVCGRVRVGKWALVMTSCLYARWMQMAKSRRGCTPAQQSMYSSNPLAFTSRFSVVAAELLISRHALCHEHLFFAHKFFSRYKNSCLGTKILFPTDSQGLLRKSSQSLRKGWIPANLFNTREGRREGGGQKRGERSWGGVVRGLV